MNFRKIDYLTKIEEKINKAGLAFFMDEDETGTTFVIDISVKHLWDFNVFLTLRDKDVVDIRCYLDADEIKGVGNKLLPVLNDLNNSNRFVCFAIDDEERLYVDYSLLINGEPEQAAKNVMTMLVMVMYVLDDALPRILNNIWELD